LKKKINRLGILGGTFDPPHEGHVYISKISIKKLKLNKLIWAVTKKNPLKNKPHLSTKTRIRLSKEINKKNKKILIKYFDNKIGSNTFDLLNFVKKTNKKSKLFFIIGADNLTKFYKWKKWSYIPKLAKIVVFPRGNYSFKTLKASTLKKLDKSDWILMNVKKINISSSLIRKIW
tara:strand:+ start:5894 stop:6418 length:525 start_codon:yes stop_codon:yes gene_type:complete